MTGVDPDRVLEGALAAVVRGRERVYYDASADREACERYYARVAGELGGEGLRVALGELLSETHDPEPRYRPAELVYPWVDLHPDRKLRSIYLGKSFAPEELIREDLRNAAIAELQGNRNPVIDHPEWVAEIDFAAALA